MALLKISKNMEEKNSSQNECIDQIMKKLEVSCKKKTERLGPGIVERRNMVHGLALS
jgi:hypothetical protein